jgi:hypothetical protein
MKKFPAHFLGIFTPSRKLRRRLREYLGVQSVHNDNFVPVFGLLNMQEQSFKEYFLTNNMPEKIAALKKGLV